MKNAHFFWELSLEIKARLDTKYLGKLPALGSVFKLLITSSDLTFLDYVFLVCSPSVKQ